MRELTPTNVLPLMTSIAGKIPLLHEDNNILFLSRTMAMQCNYHLMKLMNQLVLLRRNWKTYARDFPLKTTGGATAAKTVKRMWSCAARIKVSELVFTPGKKMLKKLIVAHHIEQEKPSKAQSTISSEGTVEGTIP